MNKVRLGVLLSILGPILFWVPNYVTYIASEYRIAFVVPFIISIIPGYIFGRELGVAGTKYCLIAPAVFLSFGVAGLVINPPPEHADLDFFFYVGISVGIFLLSLIPATIGVVMKARAKKQDI